MIQRNVFFTAVIVAGFLGAAQLIAGTSAAPRSTRTTLALSPESELWLEGKSTVHDWESSTTVPSLVVTHSGEPVNRATSAALEALIREHGVQGVGLKLRVETLHSKRKGLDKNMMKALQSDKYPTIDFQMSRYTVVSPPNADTLRLRIDGALTVCGTKKDIQFKGSAWRNAKGLWIEGLEPLLISDFGIKPPKMMLGAIKVRDEIVVHYRLLLPPENALLGVRSTNPKTGS